MSTSDIRPYFCVRKGRRYGVIDRTGALVHPLSRAENMEDFMTRYNVTAFLKEYDARFDAE